LQRLTALAEPLDSADPGPDAETAADPGPDAETAADPGPETNLDTAQQAAVAAVGAHGVSVLAGGPGTGKSRTVAAVVAMAAAHGLTVALAAPTGRAAKRLEELTGAPATTVHRLLGAQGGSRASDPAAGPGGLPGRGTGESAWVFSRNEEWPLDADLIVVDEASMLDAELAAALVEACPDGARLLLVGDPAQLPSIGPGRVLADIIDSGAVPVTELSHLYRQRAGGVIARLATAVRGGTLPPVDSPDREVVVLAARDSADAAHRVMQLITDSIPRALGIPAADIQVITPVHKGPAGTIALNQVLKERLNPGPGAHGGFDPGDRVVSVANHADAGFSNGEVGTVVGRGEGGLQVAFPAAPVCVPDMFLSDLRHGWAVTVHRAQGSEWPAVVAVFPAEAAGMLSRPLVYTALTRAQRHLSVVHGAGPALSRAVSTVGEAPRVTRLAALLPGE
jgi:exodeoxyribonuclease V alpha subunit